MKSNPALKNIFQLPVAILALCLLCMQPVFALAMPVKKKAVLTKNDPGDNTTVKGSKTLSKNKASIRIYPDPLKKIIHVVTRHNKGKEVDFFVFDLEGTLVLNYKMRSKDHQRIVGLPRGSYVYNVFCGDIQTAGGNFEIK